MTDPGANDPNYDRPSDSEHDVSGLPLVLITIGDAEGEFETLYDHLEALARDPAPRVQSLIVARPEMPDVLYKMVRWRTRDMPHVYIRKLGRDPSECVEMGHPTGKFFVSRKRKGEGT